MKDERAKSEMPDHPTITPMRQLLAAGSRYGKWPTRLGNIWLPCANFPLIPRGVAKLLWPLSDLLPR